MHERTVRLPVLPSVSPANLPTLYQHWSHELFDGPVRGEAGSTCDDCAMLPAEGATAPDAYSFNPKTRCCTYLPELANFLVGRALADDADTHPHGRRSLLDRIAAGAGVSPLGLFQHENYRMVYGNTVTGFGRSEALLCPHYVTDTNRCGIWSIREATCTTWFCKHDRGVVAKNFWNRYKQLLGVIEQALARHCFLALEPSAEQLSGLAPLVSSREHREGLSAAEIEHGYDPSAYARLWGHWAGREAEYYRECARVLGTPSWSEALAIAGSEARMHARITREAYADWVRLELPERVRVSGYQVLGMSADVVRVQSYSFLDPLALPQKLVRVLHLFDGRPLDEVLEQIEREAGEPCPPEAVRKLLDFQILTAL